MSFKKYRDVILGVVMLLFSGLYLYYAQQIVLRPQIDSQLCQRCYHAQTCWVFFWRYCLSFVSFRGSARSKRQTIKEKRSLTKAICCLRFLRVAVIIGYTTILKPLGFCLSTVIFLFLQMLVLAPPDKRRYLLFAIVSVVFTAIVFVAFRIGLQMLLPRGIIEILLGF